MPAWLQMTSRSSEYSAVSLKCKSFLTQCKSDISYSLLGWSTRCLCVRQWRLMWPDWGRLWMIPILFACTWRVTLSLWRKNWSPWRRIMRQWGGTIFFLYQIILLTFFHSTSPTISCCLQDLAELRAHITQAGVHVDVDAPKGQDLARVMEEMREKYEKIALKNQEELKAWHESQVIHKFIHSFFNI